MSLARAYVANSVDCVDLFNAQKHIIPLPGADPKRMFRGGGTHVHKNLRRQVHAHQMLFDNGYNVVAIELLYLSLNLWKIS